MITFLLGNEVFDEDVLYVYFEALCSNPHLCVLVQTLVFFLVDTRPGFAGFPSKSLGSTKKLDIWKLRIHCFAQVWTGRVWCQLQSCRRKLCCCKTFEKRRPPEETQQLLGKNQRNKTETQRSDGQSLLLKRRNFFGTSEEHLHLSSV